MAATGKVFPIAGANSDFLKWATHHSPTVKELFGIEHLVESCERQMWGVRTMDGVHDWHGYCGVLFVPSERHFETKHVVDAVVESGLLPAAIPLDHGGRKNC